MLYLRLTPLGAYCLGLTRHYTPTEPEQRTVLQALPNLDIVATEPLDAADRLLLDSYAERSADAVWRLDQTKLLVAAENGKPVEQLRRFLLARSADPLPSTVEQFLADVEQRAGLLLDQGPARLIECADPALAVLIANHRQMKKLCLQAGERHLVIKAADETRFRSALRKLGYSLALS